MSGTIQPSTTASHGADQRPALFVLSSQISLPYTTLSSSTLLSRDTKRADSSRRARMSVQMHINSARYFSLARATFSSRERYFFKWEHYFFERERYFFEPGALLLRAGALLLPVGYMECTSN